MYKYIGSLIEWYLQDYSAVEEDMVLREIRRKLLNTVHMFHMNLERIIAAIKLNFNIYEHKYFDKIFQIYH
jgi:hypothetical protein